MDKGLSPFCLVSFFVFKDKMQKAKFDLDLLELELLLVFC